MRPIHILLALCTALIWGTNFVAIKLSYESFTPFALLFVRFLLTTFPAIFFVRKPKSSWINIFYLALFLWVGQFSFLFVGMYLGASPGLAPLLMQSQTIFTLILSIFYLNHKPTLGEVIGISVATLGVVGIVYERFVGGSFLGYAMIIPAAICVSVSNIQFSKLKHPEEHPLALITWSSLFTTPVMLGLAFVFEGPFAVYDSLTSLTWTSTSSTLYTIYFSTLIAASLWAFLLKHYNPSIVVPFTLLIPVFAMVSSLLILNEEYSLYSLASSGLILLGLAINQLSRHWIPKQPLRKVV
jgi:O-acetylserine/cysteine efflux transporter